MRSDSEMCGNRCALQNHAIGRRATPVERACPRRFSPVKDTIGEDYARNVLQHIVITTNGADASRSLW